MQSVERVQRSIHAMNGSLRRKYDTVRDLLSTNTAETVRVRHKVGSIILEIRHDPTKYGARGVTLLAAALGRDEATLYRYGQVSARWNDAEITRLLARTNIHGEPISWSHLVELSAVSARAQRDALVERVLREGLSVRDLVRAIEGTARAPKGAKAEDPLSASLQEIVSTIERLRRTTTFWDEAFFSRFEQPDFRGWPPEALLLLARAEAAQEALVESCRHGLERLRTVRSRAAAASNDGAKKGTGAGAPPARASGPRLRGGLVSGLAGH